MVKLLQGAGVRSEVMYGLSLASIAGAVGAWFSAKRATDKASAERWGIFIGLWAPTFMELGNALRIDER